MRDSVGGNALQSGFLRVEIGRAGEEFVGFEEENTSHIQLGDFVKHGQGQDHENQSDQQVNSSSDLVQGAKVLIRRIAGNVVAETCIFEK